MLGKTLDGAKKIITGDRQKSYGSPEDCFGCIQLMWNTYIEEKYGHDNLLSAKDISMMMVLLKLAREMQNEKKDNIVDACGYLDIYEALKGE